MTQPAPRSFEKFNYLLRPAKQVERKLLIEALHELNCAGYGIRNYLYVGFGSPYFADFTLFHKYLYINDMICVEREPIEKRMRFNKPYHFIQLKMRPMSEVIPTLPKRKRLLSWLDYDFGLTPGVLADLDGLIQRMAPKSIVLVTVDARPRLPEEYDDPQWGELERLKGAVRYYSESFGRYVGRIEAADLEGPKFRTLLARIVRERVKESLLSRPGLDLVRIFNFVYADNAPMLTIGGILESSDAGKRLWQEHLSKLDFLTDGENPVDIEVPPLTERERQWIDSNLVGQPGARRIPFELARDLVEGYRRYARHYPNYYEAIW
jgi:hypothetical protein